MYGAMLPVVPSVLILNTIPTALMFSGLLTAIYLTVRFWNPRSGLILTVMLAVMVACLQVSPSPIVRVPWNPSVLTFCLVVEGLLIGFCFTGITGLVPALSTVPILRRRTGPSDGSDPDVGPGGGFGTMSLHTFSGYPFVQGDHTNQAQAEAEMQSLRDEVRRRLDRETALRRVECAILEGGDLHSLLHLILAEATRQVGVESACLLVVEADGYALSVEASIGNESSELRRGRLSMDSSSIQKVLKERRPVWFELNSIRSNPRAAQAEHEGFSHLLLVPLLARGRVRGVIEIFSRSDLKYAPECQMALETFSGQAALAIDNARLLEDLHRSHAELTAAYEATIEGWARVLDLRDKETEGHCQRVTETTVELARALGIPESELIHIRRGALLHDIGKMGIPDRILHKPGPLTDQEWSIMRRHPTYAYEMLFPISFLRPALEIPLNHHERWDGGGYPRGLQGEQIPLTARIFAAVDIWDALSHDRPYRPAWEAAVVREHLKQLSGSHLDPQVVQRFLEILEDQGAGRAIQLPPVISANLDPGTSTGRTGSPSDESENLDALQDAELRGQCPEEEFDETTPPACQSELNGNPFKLVIAGDVDGSEVKRGKAPNLSGRSPGGETFSDAIARFRAFMEYSPCGAFIKSSNGNYEYTNLMFRTMHKLDYTTILGKNDGDILPGSNMWKRQESDARVLEAGESVQIIESVECPDGFVREFLTLKFPFLDSSGQRMLGGVTLDVTSQMAIERTLSDQLGLAERLNVELECKSRRLERVNALLMEQATTDSLTGLRNRRAFFDALAAALSETNRHPRPLSVLMLDVDNFKAFNDDYGHRAGDEVLCDVANLLMEHARNHDLPARYGGEEFVVLLPSADVEEATAAACRLREAIARHPWPLRPVTASFGVASLAAGMRVDAQSLLEDADRALYHSKRNGRNRVTHTSDITRSHGSLVRSIHD